MGKVTKPPHQPTEESRKQAELLSGFGLTYEQIGLIVGVSKPTLMKYYGDELKLGKVKATAKVAKTLFQQATREDRPNISAAIFWMKCQGGWKEAREQDKGIKEQREDAAKEAKQVSQFKPRLAK